ncbi:hypothetical protein GCM10022420_059550 [Streptomyces iranensis]|uniref:Uncharacterized protein n=1 Tax=Streptomyces iranensis TaxID=576784 RepID=A0A060ZQV1_9ACTN|nr:predicted protein [Streptomyces iranensis]
MNRASACPSSGKWSITPPRSDERSPGVADLQSRVFVGLHHGVEGVVQTPLFRGQFLTMEQRQPHGHLLSSATLFHDNEHDDEIRRP